MNMMNTELRSLDDALPVHVPTGPVDLDGVHFAIRDSSINASVGRDGKNHSLIPTEQYPEGKDRYHHLSIVQITPQGTEQFRIIGGMDNSCCSGFVFAYDLSLKSEPQVDRFR